MSNVIDISNRFKSKNVKDDSSFEEDPNYVIGTQFLILDVHDQLALIKSYNTNLIQQGLTQENIEVASLSRLVTVAESLLSGIIFPFGGFSVKVVKRMDSDKIQYVVEMLRIENDEALNAVVQQRQPNIDFIITITIADEPMSVPEPGETDLESIYFADMDFSSVNKQTMHELVNRMAASAKIHGGVCLVNDGVIFTELPYGGKSKIAITFNCEHLRRRV